MFMPYLYFFLSFGLQYFRQVNSICVDGTAGHEGGHLKVEFILTINLDCYESYESDHLLPPD